MHKRSGVSITVIFGVVYVHLTHTKRARILVSTNCRCKSSLLVALEVIQYNSDYFVVILRFIFISTKITAIISTKRSSAYSPWMNAKLLTLTCYSHNQKLNDMRVRCRKHLCQRHITSIHMHFIMSKLRTPKHFD